MSTPKISVHIGYVSQYYYSALHSFGLAELCGYGQVQFDYRLLVKQDITDIKMIPCKSCQRLWPVKVILESNPNAERIKVRSVEVLDNELNPVYHDYLNQLALYMYDNGDDTILDIAALFHGGVIL
jgi:hypothetical protein